MGKNKPLASLELIETPIREAFRRGLNDPEILDYLHKHILDKHPQYGIGRNSLKQIRKNLNLNRTRTQNHTPETIRPAMEALRKIYPTAGVRDMISRLAQEHAMMVSKRVITEYFRQYEPHLIRERKARRLRRKKFWAAGVNDIWSMDQHDKWKYKFGLALHVGMDPVGGIIHWLKIWWTNSNPRLIASYYLETVERLGFMPMITQSDGGPENHGPSRGHTYLRHWHDPSLRGTLQHRVMDKKQNVPPEIIWSQLRRRWTPGFEDLLDTGVTNGWYNPLDGLDALVFRWVFIPYLQRELDQERERFNSFPKRADKNKIQVDMTAVEEARQLYAPPAHEVFELVPAAFHNIVSEYYLEIGSPVITRDTCWDVYLQIRDYMLTVEEEIAMYRDQWQEMVELARNNGGGGLNEMAPDANDLVGLLGGEEGFERNGAYYIGGVNGGAGPVDIKDRAQQALNNDGEDGTDDELEVNFVNTGLPTLFADFTDSEDNGASDGE